MTEPETIEAEVAEIVGTLPAVRASQAIVARDEITVEEIVAQRTKIIDVMNAVMTQGVHYGVIPGVKNPSLFKPGAETINVALRLAPHYVSEKIWHEDGHLTVFVVCTLKHIPTGLEIATGEGLCTTKESRYAYRQGERVCPACHEPAIIKGKDEYGGGWVCFKKKGGCGAKFQDGDPAIEAQTVGRIENPELADMYNTVLKMADKRALVAAVLNGTAASDVFTQDVEDGGVGAVSEPPAARQEGPEPFPVPKSWAKVREAVEASDEKQAWPLFEAFVQAASYHLFGETGSQKLTADQRKVMLQKAAGAVVQLHDTDAGRTGPFAFFDVAAQRAAWASVLDGTLLEIPDYKPPDPEAERIADEVFQAPE